MSQAVKEKESADAPPNIVGTWSLTIPLIPELSGPNNLQVIHQEGGGGNPQWFTGRVMSDGDQSSAYSIENGQVTINSQITFQLTMNGVVYSFSGTVNTVDVNHPKIDNGHWFTPDGIGNGDGNWSAQAQGGGQDEENRRGPKDGRGYSR
jgi:hypothetical protein